MTTKKLEKLYHNYTKMFLDIATSGMYWLFSGKTAVFFYTELAFYSKI